MKINKSQKDKFIQKKRYSLHINILLKKKKNTMKKSSNVQKEKEEENTIKSQIEFHRLSQLLHHWN